MINYEDFSDNAKKTIEQFRNSLKNMDIEYRYGGYAIIDYYGHCASAAMPCYSIIYAIGLCNGIKSEEEMQKIISFAISKNYWLK